MGKRKTLSNLEIESIEYTGNGIAKPDGRVVFVEGTLPGEVVDAEVTRRRKGHSFATPRLWHQTSHDRQDPFCAHFNDCGGCTWQYLPYPEQSAYKQQFVKEILQRLGGISEPEPLPIIACDEDRFYRNKMEFSFAPHRWITQAEVDAGQTIEDRRALGFHVKGRFDRVLDIDQCYLQPDPSNEIRTIAREIALRDNLTFHDPKAHTGYLRSLIVRCNRAGDFMVILVVADDEPAVAVKVLEEVSARVPSVKSTFYIVNDSQNDSVAVHPAVHVAGPHAIRERCGHLVFDIHPKSFFQTNPTQAERLYAVVRDWLDTTGSETLLDLYCGVGSIGLFLADRVGEVIGVETVSDAVDRARENAQINGISNARFMVGDVRSILAATGSMPRSDAVVLDPPRAGLHPDVVQAVMDLQPRQIIYVSCKPSTQARDLVQLTTRYRIERIQPVDMFPQTFHIENVVDLRLF